ncbi:hypothetical protein NDK25_07560 [Niallia taxi]|nr:hypothetical protein [Niallia taxi]MDE5052264.1 hypothetical protein [Niallia taxi]
MSYFRNLSEKTGGTEQKGTTDTLATIFAGVSPQVSTPTITTTVTINISKYTITVTLADNAKTTLASHRGCRH